MYLNYNIIFFFCLYYGRILNTDRQLGLKISFNFDDLKNKSKEKEEKKDNSIRKLHKICQKRRFAQGMDLNKDF